MQKFKKLALNFQCVKRSECEYTRPCNGDQKTTLAMRALYSKLWAGEFTKRH